jgi:hypothetical protein
MRKRAKRTVAERRSQRTDPDWPAVYEIRIEGHLGRAWTGWFDGLSIALEDDGDTVMTGAVVDQAALHGLLKKVRDVGAPLVSVNRLELSPAPQPTEEGD